MEPRSKARRGRAVYLCPECGYEMGAEEEPVEPVDEDDV